MNRNERAKAAQETLDIFQQGYYLFGGKKVDCQSRFTSEFLSEIQLNALNLENGGVTPKYEVVNESVVSTIFRYGGNNCGVLNFASAKNPGGGFLNGSLAQEEALALSSDLYNSQIEIPQYYDINRNCRTLLYTHNMIYTNSVTFIRDGNINLVKVPVTANILTSPAVNAGAYYRNEGGSKKTVLDVMETRMRYILKLFAAKGDYTVILGAYGCGVFGNDPVDVAGLFYKLLKAEQLENHFEKIVFAVYDRQGEQFDVFKNKFKKG